MSTPNQDFNFIESSKSDFFRSLCVSQILSALSHHRGCRCLLYPFAIAPCRRRPSCSVRFSRRTRDNKKEDKFIGPPKSSTVHHKKVCLSIYILQLGPLVRLAAVFASYIVACE
ncbi:hypothetical protein ACOSQ3_032542 [Xanthoceras sorbifolium]